MSISETMTKRHRPAFSPEFKAEVVALCHQPGKSVASVARELELTETAGEALGQPSPSGRRPAARHHRRRGPGNSQVAQEAPGGD